MRASEFDWLLLDLREMFPPNAVHYLPLDETVHRLRSLTGQDYGRDAARWTEYGLREGLCLLGRDDHPSPDTPEPV